MLGRCRLPSLIIFFELVEVLDCLSTSVDPIFLASGINSLLDCLLDTNTVSFRGLITSYRLTQMVNDCFNNKVCSKFASTFSDLYTQYYKSVLPQSLCGALGPVQSGAD
jgi:hypothetical protein